MLASPLLRMFMFVSLLKYNNDFKRQMIFYLYHTFNAQLDEQLQLPILESKVRRNV